jgi:hypothetical protein
LEYQKNNIHGIKGGSNKLENRLGRIISHGIGLVRIGGRGLLAIISP